MSRGVEVDWRDVDGRGIFTRSYRGTDVAFEGYGIKLRFPPDPLFRVFRPWHRVVEVRVVDLPDQDQEEAAPSS